MTPSLFDSRSARLVCVPADGAIAGDRVGVPKGGSAGHAILQVDLGGDVGTRAVRLAAFDEVPAGVVAIGEDLADGLGLAGEVPPGVRWRLVASDARDARELQLELPVEQSPDRALAQIASADLVGRVLWVPTGSANVLVDVHRLPYRVRRVTPDPCANGVGGVVRIGEGTTVELFAPGIRSGVDLIILADCSNSMRCDDLPVPADSRWSGSSNRYMSRAQALRQALVELLEARLRTEGRVSRIGLIAFTTAQSHRFPRGGGMIELDGSSPAELIDEFRGAISLLRPENASTDIGRALYAAADLLHRHGHPGNDRLVVLVSDGAQWLPKGEDVTGETIGAFEDPVSLMSELHADRRIRLHAIGIGTRALYRAHLRGRPPQAGWTPDHELLKQLVQVGGGDPSRIGGVDVLSDYFSGLGAGITRRAGRLRSGRPRPLSPAAISILRSAGRSGGARLVEECGELREAIMAGKVACDDLSEHRLGRPLLSGESVMKAVQRTMQTPCRDVRELRIFAAQVTAAFGTSVVRAGLPPGADGALAVLAEQLGELQRLFRTGQGDLRSEVTRLLGVDAEDADWPAGAQLACMRHVRQALSAVAADLGRMPAAPPPDAILSPAFRSRGFVVAGERQPEQADVLAGFLDISRMSRTPDSWLDGFLRELRWTFPSAAHVTILLVEEEHLVPSRWWPASHAFFLPDVATKARRERRALRWPCAEDEHPEPAQPASMAAVTEALYAPMVVGGEVVGVICVDAISQVPVFEQSHVELLNEIATVIGPLLRDVEVPKRPRLFISYAREEQIFVAKLSLDLLRRGVVPWIDKSDLIIGDQWDERITDAINRADGFLVVLSRASVASRYVRLEIEHALRAQRTVLPLRYERCHVPAELAQWHYIDVSDYEHVLDQVVTQLGAS